MERLASQLLRIILIIACLGVALRLLAPKMGEAMKRKLEDAPEDFPPKWMFLNITAIRENTERILEQMAGARSSEMHTEGV